MLSYVVAAAAALPLGERQALLAALDTATRLRAERHRLRFEIALLRQVRAVPVPLSELAVATSPKISGPTASIAEPNCHHAPGGYGAGPGWVNWSGER